MAIGHVSPEAAAGGPIAAVRDGDIVVIDVEAESSRIALKALRDIEATIRTRILF